MALFLEYSDKVKNRKYPITKPVRQHAGALYNALEKLVPKNNLKGLKDLATLKKYNVKGANSDKNGEDTNIKYITTDDAIKRLQRKGYGVGDTFIQNFLKKCVDKSTSQEEVSPVEPPKPTSNEVKPPQVKTKTIKGSNGTVSYTESKNGRKVYLSEESIKLLCEYYTQLKIPFNNPSKPYDDKQNYEHFVDWLEYVGKYGTLPSSNINEQELFSIIEANIPNAFNNFLDSDLEDYNYLDGLSSAIKYIYSMCEDSDDLRIFFNMPEEFYEDPPYDIIEFIEENDINRDDIDELKKLLTDEGIEEFNKYMRQHFIDTYTDNGIPNSLTIDNRGLIYIEREITTPNVLLTNIPDNMDMKNYFEYLRSSFNGLGNCWAWKQGRGEAYCGNYYGNNDYILLQGWVDPKSINWEETLVRNAWSLNEECEIFINDGQIVEVDKITINNASNGNYGKNILNKPMLIPI